MELFKQEIKKLFETVDISDISISVPPNPEMGDFAIPCFALSKTLKKSPQIIAEELSKKFSSNLFEKIVSNGAYLNFYALKSKIAEYVLNEIQLNNGITFRNNNPKKIMIEFSSPNTNKPLHLGHVRNMLIGESISKIHEKTGDKVIRACLVNDRGVHICKSMLAYKLWGNNMAPDKKSDHFVGDWYVRFSKEAENDASLEESTQVMLKKWEDGDKETVDLWNKMNKWVYDGFEKTYESLNIKFDKIYYESAIYNKGKEIAENGLKNGVLKKDEKGNIVAPLSEFGFEHDKVLLRADKTTVYMTQDVYLATFKFEEFGLDYSYYVVASEQNLHFKQLFKILELLKLTKTDNLKHINYGMVNLPEGKMKSREGTVVDADDLISEVKQFAYDEIEKRYPSLSEKEKEERQEIIGVGALKFFMLKFDTQKDMIYNPKESVSFDGETGPYIQYTCARINSIFEKAELKKVNGVIHYTLFDDAEKRIIIKLNDYKKAIEDAKLHLKPSLIARYLIELSQMTNEYYHSHHVLDQEENLKNARLLLLDSIRIIIKDGLTLLGIEAPIRM